MPSFFPAGKASSSTSIRLSRYLNISLFTSGSLLCASCPLSIVRLSTRAGIPTAVEFSGTLLTTTEFAPTFEFLPMVMFPSILAPAPMTTLSSSVGCLLPLPVLTPPSVTCQVDDDIITEDGCFTYDYTDTMVYEDSTTEFCCGVNVYNS